MSPHRNAGVIKAVEKDSIAGRAGVEAGEAVQAVDGHLLSDVFDWLWYSDEQRIGLTILGANGARAVDLARADDESWGIEFAQMLFDGPRRCRNDCAFCFIDQLPSGLRESLYLKDDDFRLSFFEGNFITLTNISDEDVERIITQRLSPLYVSFHAAAPQVRQRLFGSNHERGLAVFNRLVEAGIEIHVSIVLVPGVNDGVVLDQTLAYLQKRRPQVLSVGIVPVAYTCYTDQIAGATARSFTDRDAAAAVIEQVQSYQFASREESGLTWVHLADEFYIYARAPFPTTDWYDGYPQYENGIGIVHVFIEDVREHYDDLVAAFEAIEDGSEALTIITGELTVETMLGTLSALHAGGKARILPVKNRFLGGNINVTGLLFGADIIDAITYDISQRVRPTHYVIPWSIFNDDEVTLDDYTPQLIAQKAGAEAGASVIFVNDDAQGLVEAAEEVRI